jgi:TPR repeat protein
MPGTAAPAPSGHAPRPPFPQQSYPPQQAHAPLPPALAGGAAQASLPPLAQQQGESRRSGKSDGEGGEQKGFRFGKVALIGLGLIALAGLTSVAAMYLASSGGGGGGDVPVVKSDDKIAAKDGAGTGAAKPAAEEPKPADVDRDQAYTIGMNHLVNGEFDQGRQFLERADALGHPEASYNLASMYAKGDGVQPDDAKVVAYLEKSVAGGYPPAMTNLGLLYAQGQGVPQDFVKARELWEKAAAGEHPDAMHNLAVIYATGKGVEPDIQEAIKWYRKAVNAGFVESMAYLGLVYANGEGVPRDFNEAKRLWEMAAAKGHQVAAQNLAKLNMIMARQQAEEQKQDKPQ